jgi:ABC-type polar amino acid transport system ATPase subunit
MAVDPLIELRDVNRHQGEPRVPRDNAHTVGRAEVITVIGPSGSVNSPWYGTADEVPDTVRRLARGRAAMDVVTHETGFASPFAVGVASVAGAVTAGDRVPERISISPRRDCAAEDFPSKISMH